ncbi:MAG: Nramp family divalent metal transporter [Candidatus Shapirobacteria bacterium]
MKNNKVLPKVPALKNIIGPSFVLLGLALGSGELVLWPYLASQFGLGLLWGAVLGISFQFLLNAEAMRYALCWGESVFVGFRKLNKFLPFWFIISTFIPWSLPGFSSGVAEILSSLLGIENSVWIAIFFLIFVGLILSLGKTLYKTLELFQKTVVLLGLPFIIFLVIFFAKGGDWLKLALGIVGKGEGWRLIPSENSGLILASFLGAIAYAGAGGNLNLAQSYYIKEKGFGMGRFSTKISSLFNKSSPKAELGGALFANTPQNQKRFFSWWKLIQKEHLLVFWFLGLITILLLSLLSYTLVFGQAGRQGFDFLFSESQVVGRSLGGFGRVAFLLLAAGMLYSTQVGVLESTSRIISENLLLVNYQKGKKVNASLYFYLALWFQITLGIIVLLLGWTEPRFLLTLSAVLNALSMTIAFPLIWLLNKKKLPKFAQMPPLRQVFYWLGFLFLAVFLVVII